MNSTIRKQSKKGDTTAAVAATPVAESATPEEANTKLASFAQHKAATAKAEAEAKPKPVRKATSGKSIAGLPDLPKLPGAKRKAKPGQPCQCGCAVLTSGGRFLPGHDARLNAWTIRVERGILKATEVPEPHTAAVKALLKERKTAAAAGTAKTE